MMKFLIAILFTFVGCKLIAADVLVYKWATVDLTSQHTEESEKDDAEQGKCDEVKKDKFNNHDLIQYALFTMPVILASSGREDLTATGFADQPFTPPDCD